MASSIRLRPALRGVTICRTRFYPTPEPASMMNAWQPQTVDAPRLPLTISSRRPRRDAVWRFGRSPWSVIRYPRARLRWSGDRSRWRHIAVLWQPAIAVGAIALICVGPAYSRAATQCHSKCVRCASGLVQTATIKTGPLQHRMTGKANGGSGLPRYRQISVGLSS